MALSASDGARLSRADARRLLGAYHFTPRPLADTIDHLGTLQYDPLRPMGRNPDLVLQARVPGYRENDWEKFTYRRRRLVDAWEKQACLVPVEAWPYLGAHRRYFRAEWGRRVLDAYPEAVRDTLRTLERRGPLTSLDFGEDARPGHLQGSWYGGKLIKHVLRGLWMSGEVLTHHRVNGRHAYDLPSQVLPTELAGASYPGDDAAYRYLIQRRVQASGLLRPGAPAGLWSLPLAASKRHALIADLVSEGMLLQLDIEGCAYLTMPDTLALVDAPLPRGMRFVAPLDGLMWDRAAVAQLYDFEYLWEVYVPEAKRRWGYYVLPLWHQGELVGRLDGRREENGKVWRVLSLSWEKPPTAARLEALRGAARRFTRYLRADSIAVDEGVDLRSRSSLLAAVGS